MMADFTGLPEFSQSCGSVKPTDLAHVGEADANRIEAILMLARGIADKDGNRLGVRVPPAFALAVINCIGADNPQAAAGAILSGGNARTVP